MDLLILTGCALALALGFAGVTRSRSFRFKALDLYRWGYRKPIPIEVLTKYTLSCPFVRKEPLEGMILKDLGGNYDMVTDKRFIKQEGSDIVIEKDIALRRIRLNLGFEWIDYDNPI